MIFMSQNLFGLEKYREAKQANAGTWNRTLALSRFINR